MKWKLNADGSIMVGTNGNPIAIDDNEKEIEIDGLKSHVKIGTLNNENKELRLKKNKYKAIAETVEGLDISEARKAIETVKNFDADAKQIVANAEKAAEEAFAPKIKALEDQNALLIADNYKEKVTSKFALSPVLKNTFLTPKIAESYYSKHFRIEDGKTIASLDGKDLFSVENAGKHAGFDEALTMLINADPDKDSILRSNAGQGGPEHNSDGGQSQGELSSFDNIKAGLNKRK